LLDLREEGDVEPKAPLKVAIGFATGRNTFQRVLRTYVQNWQEAGLFADSRVSLHLFVAYDLSYTQTKARDYTPLPPDLDECMKSSTIVKSGAKNEAIESLIRTGVLSSEEALPLFGQGYAAQRNAILYHSIRRRMDCLLFVDDDEYPVAVTPAGKAVAWEGQHVLATHLRHIAGADITHGYHCGYISPVPHMDFNQMLTEEDFRRFIGAISNDIVNWPAVKTVMDNGGVTYSEPSILRSERSREVREVDRCKFISGSNLCVNLTRPERVFPFYNPPGARGEDTLLSTCLSERRVLRVPCYAFHDGFGTYSRLLHGVLPRQLKFIKADTEDVVARFYAACVGWIRYKPLLLYISHPEDYTEAIRGIQDDLSATLPKLCAYFREPRFMNLSTELERYHREVEKHYREFGHARATWARLVEHAASVGEPD